MRQRGLQGLTLHREAGKKHLPLIQPLRLVAHLLTTTRMPSSVYRNPGHANSLHHRPHDGQTTGFRREGINLVGSLPNIAKEAFDGIGRANIPMHDLRKAIKREQMFFILHQAAYCFGIALLVFAECSPPTRRVPPLWSRPSRSQSARRSPRCVPVWEWHS